MSEIKVRGKCIEECKYKGQWVYGFGAYKWDEDGVLKAEIHSAERIYIVDPETVGQYTGLPDKNGKEIYKGDILKYTSNERTGTRVSYKRRGYDTYSVNSDIEITGVVNKGEHDGLLTYIVETEQYTTYESYFWGSGKRSDRPDLVKNKLTKPLSTKREYEVVGNRWDNPDLLGG
ncbi:YopX protein [compost metagenome]